MKNKGKRILGFFLAVLLALCPVIDSHADELSDTKEKQEELEQQKKDAEAEKTELDTKLNEIAESMEKAQADLDAKQLELSEVLDELDAARIREAQQYEDMKLRIKFMYEHGDTEFIEILFTAEDISDFLNKAEYIKQISDYDREQLEVFSETVHEVEEKEEQVKEEEEELRAMQDELTTQQEEVTELLAETQTQISSLEEQIGENGKKLEELVQRAEAEKNRYNNSSGGGSAGPSQIIGEGQLAWPTTSHRITSYFGPRKAPVAGATTWHDAIDIGAPMGTPVYAADGGKVITARGGYNGGRGTYIMVDHGNGIVTRYQHLSAMYVSVGQTVSKGQNIAAVGTTGASSGPHLDYAIYVNGKTVDPLTYY